MRYYRTYKYRINPNKEQTDKIQSIMLSVNMVRNLYRNEEKHENRIVDTLERYIKDRPGLKDTDYSALYNCIRIMQYNKKLCSQYNKFSYTTKFGYDYSHANILKRNLLFLPYVGSVKINMHRPIPSSAQIYTVCIMKKAEEYYALLCMSIDYKVPEQTLDINKSIGLDYSPAHFYVDDKGNEVNLPRLNKLYKDSLKRAKRNKKKKSRVWAKINNTRADNQHKLSRKLVNEYDYIFVETLDLSQFEKIDYLQKSTVDNAYSMFIDKLDYKAKENGKKLCKINRWFPSTRICNKCRAVNRQLTLNDRVWICENCGSVLNRDQNAAINIKKEGIRMIRKNFL